MDEAALAALSLEAGVEAWVQADVPSWRIDPHALPGVIVSETMSAALKREAQVAITRNLLRQGDCSLNTPRFLEGKPRFEGGQQVQFCYRLGSDPGIDYTVPV